MNAMNHARVTAPVAHAGAVQNYSKMREMRRTPRRATNLPALVKSEGLYDFLSCQVTDLSMMGARLRLTERDRMSSRGPTSLAGRLTLNIRLERLEVDCRVVWRNSSELGVAFLSAPRLLAR